MRTLIRHQLAILLTATAMFFIGLGAPKLWDEDEPEYARCTQEMLQRGDFIVPTFNHHLWTDKPVLLYWLQMGSFAVFGQTEFGARFPCALLALGTALMTYHLGRRLFRPQIGLWAGLIVATTASFAVVGRAAAPDSPLIFFTTFSLICYVFGVRREMWAENILPASPILPAGRAQFGAGHERVALPTAPSAIERFRAVLPRSWWWYVGMYAPLGLAILAKGPVGVLLPVAALGVWVLTAGAVKTAPRRDEPAAPPAPLARGASPVKPPLGARLSLAISRVSAKAKSLAADLPAATWAMRPITLVAVVAAVAVPWYVAVGILTHGEWTKAFFFHHNVDRFFHTMEQHAGSLFYYPVAVLIGFFPWALSLVLGLTTVVRRLRRGEAGSRAMLFALCWSATWFVVFSLSASKLSHYVEPTYPLLAVIAAIWISDWINVREAMPGVRWFRMGWPALAAIGVAMMIALPLVVQRFAPGAPSSNWLGLILIAGAAAGWHFQRREQPVLAASTMVVMSVALMTSMFAVAGPPLSEQQESVRLLAAVNKFGDKTTPIATYRIRLPDFVFYAARNEPILGVRLTDKNNPVESIDWEREFAGGAANPYQPDDTRLWLDNLDNALLITDMQGLEELRPILPADAVVLAREKRFLKRGDLLLVGRKSAAAGAELAERASGELK